MRFRTSIVGLFGAALLAASVPAIAHHAVAAEFDTHKPITFTGTVKQLEWTNPHIYTSVEVKNPDGTMTVYRVEGGPPNALFRQGWRKDSLKAGDMVTVTGLRAKNENSMNVGQATITTADGRRMFAQTGGNGGQ
jgi:DNA/RNA endonuclease YhcR with UshA esterase domain